MNAEIRAVIFDSDGTLVDSETISMAVLVDYVAELGLTVPHTEAMECFAGGELPKVFAEIQRRLGGALPDDHLGEFRRRQLARLAVELQPVEGAAEILSSMSLPFCVASNAPRNKVSLCMRATGLDAYVAPSMILSAYEIDAWKPDPDLFLAAAQHLNVAPEHCAVVEDSAFGIQAGIAAGMRVFALTDNADLINSRHVQQIGALAELRTAFRIK